MNILHEDPLDFMIPIESNYIETPNYIPTPYYKDTTVGFDIGDAFYTLGYPELQLSQFRDLTHDIYYYWNGFTEEGRNAVLNNFYNFHPLNGVIYDSLNSWDDIDRYWFIPDSYYDEYDHLSDDGWARGYALLAYMKAVADKYLKSHYNDACNSRDKAIAKGIWETLGDSFLSRAGYVLISQDFFEIRKVAGNLNYKNIRDDEIINIYNLMKQCHNNRKKFTNNNIQDFLKKVCSDGITYAAANFKKYLLLKKKYLDKKTLKK